MPIRPLSGGGVTLIASLALLGCGGSETPNATAPSSSVALSSAPSATAAAAPEPKDVDFREALRRLDYAGALARIDALPEEQQKSPPVRLATGRAALGVGDGKRARAALAGLEGALPALAVEIQLWRAESEALAGPFDKAATFLEASPLLRNRLLAAEARRRGGDLAGAHKLLDAVIRQAEKTRRKRAETEAHLLRGQIAIARKKLAVAVADFRWLAQHAAEDEVRRDGLKRWRDTGIAVPVDDELDVLATSTNAVNQTATLERLDELSGKAPALALDLARARALYRARDYPLAIAAFDKVLSQPGPHLAEAMYHHARANVRTGEVEVGLRTYQQISRRFADSMWAERAAYRYAELLLLQGRYEESYRGFRAYSSRFGKSAHRRDARYGAALALLSANTKKSARRAKKELSALRKDAPRWREASHLRHLEALAAWRAGEREKAVAGWRAVVAEHPLTYPALMARARLAAVEAPRLPAPIGSLPPARAPMPVVEPPGVTVLRDVGLDLEAEATLQRSETDISARYPGRESEALCTAYEGLSTAARRAKLANRAVPLEVLMRAPTSEERWQWECIYPRPFSTLVAAAAKRFEVPLDFVYAIMRQESSFRTTVRSPVGARGLMQLMPATAARAAAEAKLTLQEADDIVRPDLNVQLGTFYLGKLLKNFDRHAAVAAAGYNAGPKAAARWLAHCPDRELDMWVARIPYRETRHYVQRVLGNYARYAYLRGGLEAIPDVSLALPTEVNIGEDAY
ncbi:MAG: transglycosylase SLT domain-containing protein [Myxococcota bacterium]